MTKVVTSEHADDDGDEDGGSIDDVVDKKLQSIKILLHTHTHTQINAHTHTRKYTNTHTQKHNQRHRRTNVHNPGIKTERSPEPSQFSWL